MHVVPERHGGGVPARVVVGFERIVWRQFYSRSPKKPSLQLLQEFQISLYDPVEAYLEHF